MSEVQYNEENFDLPRRQDISIQGKSTLFKFVEHFGVPEEHMNKILLGIAVILVAMSFLFFKNSISIRKTEIKVPPGNVLITPKNGPPRLEYPVN